MTYVDGFILPLPKGKEPLPDSPAEYALASLCQALLTANSFLYVD